MKVVRVILGKHDGQATYIAAAFVNKLSALETHVGQHLEGPGCQEGV